MKEKDYFYYLLERHWIMKQINSKIRINDVGDGTFIETSDSFMTQLVIDFGSQQPNKLDKNSLNDSNHFITHFLVSHYHIDHYNGLLALDDDSINIDILYYPFIPIFPQSAMLLRYISFLEYIVLGSNTGSPANDLLNLLSKKNKSEFEYKALKKGDNIPAGKNNWHVIWPPVEISDQKILKSLSAGIRKIEDIVNNNVTLKNLFRDFDRYKDEGNGIKKKDNNIYKKDIQIEEATLQSISKAVSAITNRFSVCLLLKQRCLFMGDVESAEIKEVVKYVKKEYGLNHIRYLVTPHHGTHWDDSLNNIYAHTNISSNGKKMIRKYKENYKTISSRSLSTYINGSLEFMMDINFV